MSDELLKQVPCKEQPLLPGLSESASPGTQGPSLADGIIPKNVTAESATLERRSHVSPTLVYDGSFNGLLCSLNQLLTNQVVPGGIVAQDRHQPSFFDEVVEMPTSDEEAALTWGKICSYYSRESQRNIATAFAADASTKELIIYNYLVYGIQAGKDLDRCHSVDAVREMHELCQRVRYEAHRLKGLLRFQKVESGVFYGPFESDHVVICQLANFFRHRLNNQEWLLHDTKRGLMIYWDTEELHQAEPDLDGDPIVAEDEEQYQALWQTFFNAVVIKERLNPRLQRQLMPKRYWKYLTEMS